MINKNTIEWILQLKYCWCNVFDIYKCTIALIQNKIYNTSYDIWMYFTYRIFSESDEGEIFSIQLRTKKYEIEAMVSSMSLDWYFESFVEERSSS